MHTEQGKTTANEKQSECSTPVESESLRVYLMLQRGASGVADGRDRRRVASGESTWAPSLARLEFESRV